MNEFGSKHKSMIVLENSRAASNRTFGTVSADNEWSIAKQLRWRFKYETAQRRLKPESNCLQGPHPKLVLAA
jgi:hypothetical protein